MYIKPDIWLSDIVLDGRTRRAENEVARGVGRPRPPRPPTGNMADGDAKYTATLLSVGEIESPAVQSATSHSNRKRDRWWHHLLLVIL